MSMDLNNVSENLVPNSTATALEGDVQNICTAEPAGEETQETYCADQLNVSANSCECDDYFEVPESVMDVYLLALDGGDESKASLRQLSDVFGRREEADKEGDSNCNHNVNSEPCPNEGCGCTGSYNGGAGGGTAVCGCDGCGSYEGGFRDKKRDPQCCGNCTEDTYQKGLTNKKPNGADEYVPGYLYPPGVGPNCAANCLPLSHVSHHHDHGHNGHGHHHKSSSGGCGCGCESTYQEPLCNKKPDCPEKYEVPPIIPEPYCRADDPTCCYSCNKGQHHHHHHHHSHHSNSVALVKHSPDRSTFYADESCECCQGPC